MSVHWSLPLRTKVYQRVKQQTLHLLVPSQSNQTNNTKNKSSHPKLPGRVQLRPYPAFRVTISRCSTQQSLRKTILTPHLNPNPHISFKLDKKGWKVATHAMTQAASLRFGLEMKVVLMLQAVLIVRFHQSRRAIIFQLGTLWASGQGCRELRKIGLMYHFFRSNQQWSFQKMLPGKLPLTLVKENFWAKVSWLQVFQAKMISCKSLLAFVK